MLGRNDVKLSPLWQNEVKAPSGVVPFLQAIFSSLKNAGIAITVVGGVVLLFPAVLATLGLAATAAIVFVPSFLFALIAGVSAYREAVNARDQEKLLRQQLEEHFSMAEKNLAAMQANIEEAYQLLNSQQELSKESRQRLLMQTLKTIEAVRVLAKKSDYERDRYSQMVDAYNQLASPQVYQASIVLASSPQKTGFFAGLYQDTKKFFSDLNAYRKAHGIGWTSLEFLAKSWQIASPFLGGVGLGLTLGAAAIGVTTMALGTGASFTGIGAIGGLPAVAVGAILIGVAVVTGLLTMGIKYLVSKRHQQRLDTIKTLTTTFSTINAQHKTLNAELASIRVMQVAQDKDKQLAEREERLNKREEELKRREEALAIKEKQLAEKESPVIERKRASQEIIYEVLNKETSKMLSASAQGPAKNDETLVNGDEKKKTMGS